MNTGTKAPGLRLCAAIVALTAVSGCLGSGGGGGGFTPADYDDALADVQGRIPTSDIEREGSATYSGATRLEGIGDDGQDFVVGEVNLDVNFGAAPTEAISGTASNFTGTIDGKDIAIGGTLCTGPDFPTGLATSRTRSACRQAEPRPSPPEVSRFRCTAP